MTEHTDQCIARVQSGTYTYAARNSERQCKNRATANGLCAKHQTPEVTADAVAAFETMRDSLSSRSPREVADIAARSGLSEDEVAGGLAVMVEAGTVNQSYRGYTSVDLDRAIRQNERTLAGWLASRDRRNYESDRAIMIAEMQSRPEFNSEVIAGRALESGCPATIDGQHDIEWMTVPASVHDGDLGELHTESHERGFCWACDERFTR